jgi:acetoin utilization deacetylase AcuC-like enzyme
MLQFPNYSYGGGNPMRPHRVRLTTKLVEGYGLHDKMRILRPHWESREGIMQFHADGEHALEAAAAAAARIAAA